MEDHVPSFSSSLLDAIYRSIDHPHPTPTQLTFSYTEPMKVKGHDTETYRHMGRDLGLQHKSTNQSFVPGNSSVISSDSSKISSYKSEFAVSRSSSSCYSTKRPKPSRTSISADDARTSVFRTFLQARSSKKPCVSVKLAQRDGESTMKPRPTGKSHGDSKKAMRQPISPGGKLTSFLNSIFHTKKARIVVQNLPEPSDHSACSSTSSFSRSWLSVKTTPSTSSSSSRRKSTEKRTVRFCPVNFILDEDCRPCGHKSPVEGAKSRNVLGGEVAAASEVDFNVMMKENRRVLEATREMQRNYQKRKERYGNDSEDGGDEGEDEVSCASSDLFELDNFDCYREDLPVYGTTSIGTNRAIANGLML